MLAVSTIGTPYCERPAGRQSRERANKGLWLDEEYGHMNESKDSFGKGDG